MMTRMSDMARVRRQAGMASHSRGGDEASNGAASSDPILDVIIGRASRSTFIDQATDWSH